MLDLRKHDAFGENEQPSRAGFNALSLSINDFVPVANVTERAQLVADLNAIGRGPSAGKPLMVYRADARDGFRLEVSENGTSWRAVNQPLAGGVQERIQRGSTTGTTAGNGTLPLTFSEPFVGTPVVTVSAGSTAGGVASVACTGVATATGQQVVCYTATGALVTGQNVRVNWIAVGY